MCEDPSKKFAMLFFGSPSLFATSFSQILNSVSVFLEFEAIITVTLDSGKGASEIVIS